MADHHTPDWIGPALGTAGAVLTGFLAYLGVRFTAKTNPAHDPQDAINDGFEGLLARMRSELDAASLERAAMKATMAEREAIWQATLSQREAAWALEREAFKGEIAQLRAVSEGFERLLRRNGITIPQRRTYPTDPAHAPAQEVGTTLRQDPAED